MHVDGCTPCQAWTTPPPKGCMKKPKIAMDGERPTLFVPSVGRSPGNLWRKTTVFSCLTEQFGQARAKETLIWSGRREPWPLPAGAAQGDVTPWTAKQLWPPNRPCGQRFSTRARWTPDSFPTLQDQAGNTRTGDNNPWPQGQANPREGGRQGQTGDPERQLTGAAQFQPNLMKKHALKPPELLILKKQPEIELLFFFLWET